MGAEEIPADLAILLSDPHQWPNFKGYRPLSQQTREIRLLEIHVDEAKTLRGHIRHASLKDEEIEYEALSYCWGPPTRLRAIHIDDEEDMIRSSLHAFLLSLCTQPEGQKLPVWADAICIYQQDVTKRNWQVGMMGAIYSKASQVLVWLGELSPEAEIAFLYLGHYQDQRLNESKHRSLLEQKAREGFEDIAGRPYWMRLWIVQEIMLAKSVTIWCGDCFVGWSEFLREKIA